MFNIFWLLYHFLFHFQTHLHHSMFSISFRLTLVIAVVITNWHTSELVDLIGFFITDKIVVLMLLLEGLLDSLLYTRVDFLLDEMLDLVSIVIKFPCFFAFQMPLQCCTFLLWAGHAKTQKIFHPTWLEKIFS